MSKFYDKYKLSNSTGQPPSPDNTHVNILKDKFSVDYSDYEKLKIAEQYNKLYSSIYEKNKSEISISENKKIYNLSLYELTKKSGQVYINLLNDISIYFSYDQKPKSLNTLGLILTKDDNLLYIGILVLLISFFLWLIDITS
jgi:hypothetical protein